MRDDCTFDFWASAIGDLAEHRNLCSIAQEGCSAPFSSVIRHCPAAVELASIEQSAYRAWRAAQRGEAGTP